MLATAMNVTSPHLLIATPAYNGMVHVDYVQSLMEIGHAGIPYTLTTTAGESLITRARNSMISRFHANKEYTHLLFLDGDVRISGNAVSKLLKHKKDVIGAPVPLKQNPDEPKVFNIGGIRDAGQKLTRVERVGTAVLMLSRRAVEELVRDAVESGNAYKPSMLVRGEADVPQQYDVFRTGVRNGEYLSEDFWACYRLSELGFDIYVDLTIRIKHYGMFDFSTFK